jgi:hypothetical protein
MVKIYIKGIKHSNLSRSEIKEATNFFLSKLMSKRLSNTLTLFIKFNDKKYGYSGLCTWLDDPIRPKEFEINIRNDPEDEQLSTLAHEMVHVKQYAKGELRDLLSKPDILVWKGARRSTIETSSQEYLDFPWEKEAFGLEKELVLALMTA